GKLHNAMHELGPSAMVLRAIIEVDDQGRDVGKSVVHHFPPPLQTVDETVTRVNYDLDYTVSSMKGGTDYVTVSRYPHPYHRRVRFDQRDRGRVYGPGAPL